MYIFLAILYLLVGAFLFYCLIKRNKKNGIIGAYSGIVFGMILYYIVVPILIMLNIGTLSERFAVINDYIHNKEWTDYIYALFLILISFIALHFGYCFKQEKKEENKNNDEKINKILKIVAWATFIVGGVSLIIFFIGFGGIRKALEYANTARSFDVDLSEKVPYYISILVIPMRLITVSTFLFLWLDSIYANEAQEKGKNTYKVLAIISFICSILFLLYNAGKAPLITFLLSFFVAFLYRTYQKNLDIFNTDFSIINANTRCSRCNICIFSKRYVATNKY